MSPKQRSTWRKLFSPHQIKASYVSETNISEQKFAFGTKISFPCAPRMQFLGV